MRPSCSSIGRLCIGVAFVASSCGKPEQRTERPKPAARSLAKPDPSIAALLTAGPPTSAPSASKELEEPAEDTARKAAVLKGLLKIGKRRLVQDELVDVGPAGPSAALSVGVLLITREGRTLIASLGPGTSNSPKPTKTPVATLDVAAKELVALERGPAVSAGYAYFVLGDHLVRRKVPNGALENLADDARAYTRVAVPDLPVSGAPAIAAYIARNPTDKSTLVAKVWVEGQGGVTLTPDGSAGNSVALARANNGYIATYLESRTGMSPLHARRIHFEGVKVHLGSDVVPWIGGTAQSLSEVFAIGDPTSVWALLPMERGATHFGLARITLGLTPRMGAEVHWREYPNGLDPAVVASGYVCDRPVVLYARPATAEPHATQELHLASIGDDGLGPSAVVANSRAFADASLATLDGGALVVYVADRRTWARRLRCVP